MGRLGWVLAFCLPSVPALAHYSFGLFTHEYRYISPQNTDDFEQVLKFGPWEQFHFERSEVDHQGQATWEDVGYLRSDKGVYIGVEGEEVVQKHTPGPWELFERIHLPDGKVGFRNLAFDRYLSFEHKLRTRPHLQHWEAFVEDWRYGERKVSTAVFLIEGDIPNFRQAKHGGLLFVNNYSVENEDEDNYREAHFMPKDFFFGGDGMIGTEMKLLNIKKTKLGDIDLTVLEAMVWCADSAKTKRYRVATFNCWKLPIAFAREFKLQHVDEPIQNDLLALGAGLFHLPMYVILARYKKI